MFPKTTNLHIETMKIKIEELEFRIWSLKDTLSKSIIIVQKNCKHNKIGKDLTCKDCGMDFYSYSK